MQKGIHDTQLKEHWKQQRSQHKNLGRAIILSVEFLSIFRMSSPPAETKVPPQNHAAPLIENFLAMVLP